MAAQPNLDGAPALGRNIDLFPAGAAHEDFASLLTLLRYAVHGCFAIAIYKSVPVREQVVNALREAIAPLPVYDWTYSPLDPSPYNYLNRLSLDQQQQRGVVFLYNVESGGKEAWPGLDMQRDFLAAHPHGLVFWITPKARGEAIRNAPNFWSQRSGVFDFTVDHSGSVNQSRDDAWRSEQERDVVVDDPAETERQVRLYQGLVEE